ncbi:MAG TPA: alpha-amylase family glycosyl hydrolase, partial [Chthoniobacteraceae bacterium]|nr:alpha-amylase family glycosyl hydrolase [Chthoniobacteraceae bacterium]
MKVRSLFSHFALLLGMLLSVLPARSHGEAMLQFFNNSWDTIAQKMPELAEAGYDSLWLPPPTMAGSGLSVGYDCFDAFDLGDNESGYAPSNSTNYGTQADLINLVQVAHRFGIRVYLDNVCNHRGFAVPGSNASVPITYYPGMLPEDFHLLTLPSGYYENTYQIADWNNSWDVINESLEGLADIANEPGSPNLNFGSSVGDQYPKISFVRTPNHPDFYCYDPSGNYVGFGANNGLTTAIINANPSAYSEYVEDFQNRTVRWEIDTTKADGIRLDAVKSVQDNFFGSEGSDQNTSTYGYTGQIQLQYDLTHGVTPSNLRASCFNTEIPRTNAVIFGEHLGAPPPQLPYINAGMRLLDNDLNSAMDGDFPYGPLSGFDSPGGNGIQTGGADSENATVAYVQSADYGYAAKQQLQYAFVLARAGLPVVYTDGYNYAPVLGSDGKPFPANSYNNYLGQNSDPSLVSMLYVHNQFSRGSQAPLWSDDSTVAFERQDNRENTNMTASDATVLLFLMNGNGAAGQAPNSGFSTDFPLGAYLWQYAQGTTDSGDTMSGFYYTVGANTGNQTVSDLIIPKDGYFAFSWRTPEPSDLWKNGGGSSITLLQNGQPCSTITYTRTDGPNGDPDFNPYGVSGAVAGSYSYPWTVPCVTGTNLTIIGRADGSAQNMMMELDGGVDINSQMGIGPQSGELRDNPPAVATDVFLGYEQMGFVDRENPELFGAVDTTRCQIGSTGAETYITTVGSEQFTEN